MVDVQLKRDDGTWQDVEISGYVASPTAENTIERKMGGTLTDRSLAGKKNDYKYLELLAAAEQASQTGSYIRNTETQKMQYSLGLLNLLELEPEEVNADNLFNLKWARYHPDELPMHEERLDKIKRREALEEIEYRICLPDGRIRWVQHRLDQYLSKNEVLGIFRDITATKETQMRMRTTEARFQGFMDHLPLPAWIKDEELRYVFANKALQQLQDKTVSEILGKTDADFHEPEIAAVFRKNDQALLANGKPLIVSERVRNADGDLRYVRSHKFIIKDAEGNRYVAGAALDVTELILAQQELQSRQQELIALNGSLEEQIATRTEELNYFIKGLTKLLQLSYEPFDSIESVIEAYLQTGVTLFDLEVGIVSEITNNDYLVLGVNSPFSELKKGIHFELSNTLCEKVIETKETIFYPHIGQSDLHTHPVYQSMQLESYIGTPILVDGAIVGTLNFSSLSAQTAAYLKWKKPLVEFMAQSIGALMRLYKTRQELAESNTRFRSLVEYAPMGITMSLSGNTISFANRSFARSLGYEPEELMKKNWKELTVPDDLEGNMEALAQLARGETNHIRLEKRYLHKQGHHVWCRLSITVLPRQNNETLPLIAVIEDITAERETQEQLQRQKIMIEEGEKVARLGTWVLDSRDMRAYVSPAVYDIYELDPSIENIFPLTMERIHPEDLPMLQARLRHSIEHRQLSEIECRILLPDGRLKWIRGTAGRFLDQYQMLGTVQDITHFKLQSEKLVQTNQELEQLLYTVSHDLRAPVRHISSYAQMMRELIQDRINEEEAEFLQNVLSASARLGNMIDELLDYSRSRNVDMKKKWIDLNPVVDSIRNLFAQDTESRQIVWEIADLPNVFADRSMIDKVFLNLLSNAVKFTEKQANPKITIYGKKIGTRTQITVQDNGAGFEMQYKHKLFEVFQRLHKQRDFKGTGIGLANVHRIILRHGGTIDAESEVGKGTQFYFTLPNIP